MEYSVSLLLLDKIDIVFSKFISIEHMLKWEKGLLRVENITKRLLETGNEGFLVFGSPQGEMKMAFFVKELQAPSLATIIYELPGAYNQCINRFEQTAEGTKWTMDVIFRFDQKMDLPLEALVNKTKTGMMLFQEYIEATRL